jgi:hypothetical protein
MLERAALSRYDFPWALTTSQTDAVLAFERGEELRPPTRGDDPQRLPSA